MRSYILKLMLPPNLKAPSISEHNKIIIKNPEKVTCKQTAGLLEPRFVGPQ